MRTHSRLLVLAAALLLTLGQSLVDVGSPGAVAATTSSVALTVSATQDTYALPFTLTATTSQVASAQAVDFQIRPASAGTWETLDGIPGNNISGRNSGPYKLSVTALPADLPPNGLYDFRVMLTTDEGTQLTSPLLADQLITDPDNPPPVVTLNGGLLGGAVLSGTVSLKGQEVKLGDVGPLDGVRFVLTSPGAPSAAQGRGLAYVAMLPGSRPPEADLSFDTTTVPDGTYDLWAEPFDMGLTSYPSIPARSVIIDNTPPTVTLSPPPSPVSGRTTLTATACDSAPSSSDCSSGSGIESVQYQRALHGSSTWTQLATASVAPSYSASVDTTYWPDGTYDMRAIATDRAGHTTISQSVTFTTANPTPPPPVSLSVAGTTAPASQLTILGTDTTTGETWATGFTRAAPATGPDGRLLTYPDASDQLVLLEHTDAGGWQIADVLRGADGTPFSLPGGPASVRVSGTVLADGEGWLWVSDSDFAGIFHRAPGGHFIFDAANSAAIGADLLCSGPNSVARNVARLRVYQSGGSDYGILTNAGQSQVTSCAGATTPSGPTGEPSGACSAANSSAAAVQTQYATLDGSTWTCHTAPLPPASMYTAVSGDVVTLQDADLSGPDEGWAIIGRNRGGSYTHTPLWLARFGGDGWSYAPSVGLDALDLTGRLASSNIIFTPLTIKADGTHSLWVSGTDGSGNTAAQPVVAELSDDGSTVSTTDSWCTPTTTVASSCSEPLGDAAVPDATLTEPSGEEVALAVNTASQTDGLDVYSNGAWRLLPVAGYSSGVFASVNGQIQGWLGGSESAATGEVTAAGANASPLSTWPVADRSPLTGVALPPGSTASTGETGAVAVGFNGAALLYTADNGWVVQALPAAAQHLYLTGVAFDGPSSAFAVGQAGEILHWDGSAWTTAVSPNTLTPFRLDSVAFASDGEGWAVGENGTILHYDGTSWGREKPPADDGRAAVTSVAVAGGDVFAIDGGNLIERGNDGTWNDAEPALAGGADAPQAGSLRLVAGLPDGAAVIGGVDTVLERDAGSSTFHDAGQPISGVPVALTAFENGGSVSAAVSIARPVSPITNPAIQAALDAVGSYPSPDGELLLGTDGGWLDLSDGQQADSSPGFPVLSDGEVIPDPVLAVTTSPDGQHLWAVGGYDGTPNASGYGSGDFLDSRPIGWQTASVWRYDAGGSATAPEQSTAAPSLPASPATVSLAFFSSPECLVQCSAVADAQPWVNLAGAINEINAYAGQPSGPAFAVLGGDAVGPHDQTAFDDGNGRDDFARLPDLLAPLQVPLFAAFGSLDKVPTESDPTQSWSTAFAGAPAPQGAGGDASAVTPVSSGAAAPGTTSRYYSFDAQQNGGRLRVIVLDNSAGSLDGSEPGQGAWLDQQLAAAAGIPTIVVAAQALSDPSTTDGEAIAAKLVQAGVLAVFTGPSGTVPAGSSPNRVDQVPDGAAQTIPEYEGASLGYQQTQDNGVVWYDASVDTTNDSVSVSAVPLVQSLALQALRGNEVQRGLTLQYQAIGRRAAGTIAYTPVNSEPGYDNYVEIPASGCAGCIEPTYSFSSSNPKVIAPVTPTAAGSPYPKLVNGKAVLNSQSGLFCAFGTGTATITLATGLQSASQTVTVDPGPYGSYCGQLSGINTVSGASSTVRSAAGPARVVRVTAAGGGAAPPPPPAAAAAVSASAAAPLHLALPQPPVQPASPPARLPHVAPASPPAPPPVPPPATLAALTPLLAVVPPPVVPAQPIPPGGATAPSVSQQPASAERREKAVKHAESSAYTLLQPAANDSHVAWWYEGAVGLTGLLAMALAGRGLRPRRRPTPAPVRSLTVDRARRRRRPPRARR